MTTDQSRKVEVEHQQEVEWLVSPALVPYQVALAFMERRVDAILRGTAGEAVWLLQHPPLYTAGTSAEPGDLLDSERFPVFNTGRGGRYTYHGPGQRVAYVMLDLRKRGQDVRAFVHALEAWIIAALARHGVTSHLIDGRVGVWVDAGGFGEAKIAALGVRVRRWISFHGIAVNVCPDLTHFGGIVPCGLADSHVTSLAALGKPCTLEDFDQSLRSAFAQVVEGR